MAKTLDLYDSARTSAPATNLTASAQSQAEIYAVIPGWTRISPPFTIPQQVVSSSSQPAAGTEAVAPKVVANESVVEPPLTTFIPTGFSIADDIKVEKPSPKQDRGEGVSRIGLRSIFATAEQMPKFNLYGGHGDPVAHLRGYCSKMRGAGRKDKLLMAYFSQSLSGEYLEWYTRQDASRWYTWDYMAQAFSRHFLYIIEIVPDRMSLSKMEKRPNESFREYGLRWKEQVA
ncbi:PREDICTED: uncharacterized protein LOC109242300 [Nicotiana attenuata]|uniref:uncharacterized protein LOC109242300 n=1 Tax=Nicotiana attenuata TaxID=49451 RepID=UPI000904C4E3|nr:PREDICTED: uncharacterized protein LOC109242300 [Nicotiana attenuata]